MDLTTQHATLSGLLFNEKDLGDLVEERTVFSMFTLGVQTEEDYRPLKDIEKVDSGSVICIKEKDLTVSRGTRYHSIT